MPSSSYLWKPSTSIQPLTPFFNALASSDFTHLHPPCLRSVKTKNFNGRIYCNNDDTNKKQSQPTGIQLYAEIERYGPRLQPLKLFNFSSLIVTHKLKTGTLWLRGISVNSQITDGDCKTIPRSLGSFHKLDWGWGNLW